MLKDTMHVELRQADAMHSWSYTFTDRYTIRSELSCDTLKWFTFSNDKKKYLFLQGSGVYPWNEGRLQQWEFGYILPLDASESITHVASTLPILKNTDISDTIDIKYSLDYGKSINSIKIKPLAFDDEISNIYWSGLKIKSEHGHIEYNINVAEGYIYKISTSGLKRAALKSASDILKLIQDTYADSSSTESSIHIEVLTPKGLTSWRVSPNSKSMLLLWATIEESFSL